MSTCAVHPLWLPEEKKKSENEFASAELYRLLKKGCTVDKYAMLLGYAVMAACGTAAASAAVIGAVMLLNRATWKLLEPYGGIKTFNKFRKWYWAQPENKKLA